MRRSPSLGGRRVVGCGALARSLARHPFLFGGGFQPPTHKTSNQAGGSRRSRGSRRRARDIIIKSVCKVGCVRSPSPSLGRCQRRVASFASPSQYYIFTWAPSRRDLSLARLASSPRGGRISLSLPIVDAVENEICPSFPLPSSRFIRLAVTNRVKGRRPLGGHSAF